ncbi:MAG: ribonucleotide-diphosphate reductase subunit beta [Actinomycetota bacterium]|nr:ribonucleotide-diphosphate reductase subunit beta [Actinomycetota bacterium]
MGGPLDGVSYGDLYRRWEQGNWRASELDFERDRRQWETDFSEFERRAALWNYALFFWGEDAVTDGLSPYIEAAPLEEQKYFLATQQADEARHAVFFARFMHEVAGIGDGSVGAGLTEIRPQLTWGFERVFGRLEATSEELRRDPSVPRLAAAVALYHVVIEAALAQTGQHFITGYLAERDLLPGFRDGMENVAADEQRHIGFGVKLLSDLREMDGDVPHAVAEMLREVLPWAIAVLVPPGWDERYITAFGSTFEDLAEAGVISIMSKLRSAGLPLDELPGPPVFPVLGEPRERAERSSRLLRCGYIGEKTRPPSTDPGDVRLLFETVATGLDGSAAAEPGVIQWDLTDAEPWHIAVSNGRSEARPGRFEEPRLSLRARFEDMVDLVAGRKDPRRLLATGRLRPRGDLRWVWRSRRMFPPL